MIEKSSSPSTQPPLLRVSRPVSACSRCRSAKVKCDGKLPACTACERAGKAVECTGGSDQFARGKERSYMASLESRLERLERRLAQLDAAAPKAGESSAKATTADPKAVRKRRVEAGEIEELVADLGYMAINAVTRDFYGFSNDLSYGSVALMASKVSGALDSKPAARLPPRHTATQLIQHYFDKIFTTLPCLNEASFFGAVESVYRDEAAASEFDVFCVYMVLAVGTMSLSRSQDSPAANNAACFVKTALQHVDSVISPSEIKGVQATLLLVQYSMLEPAHFNSWYLIGVASRIMIDIGLHQEPLETSKRRATETDLRRRIFYCVYTLDRSISMVLQRPFTFSDDSVNVHLPRLEDPSLTETLYTRGTLVSMAAATHLFSLRQLQSSWYQMLHLSGSSPLPDAAAYLTKHTSLLAAWKSAIPATLPASTRDWLLLEWHYLNVYILSPSPRHPRFAPEIFTHCTAYPLVFRGILKEAGSSRVVYTYHDALRTYFVGTTFLHGLYEAEGTVLAAGAPEADIERAVDAIHAIVFVLSTMIIRWPDAEALRDKFRSEAQFVLVRLKARLERIMVEQWEMQQQEMQQQQWRLSGHVATQDFGNLAFYR